MVKSQSAKDIERLEKRMEKAEDFIRSIGNSLSSINTTLDNIDKRSEKFTDTHDLAIGLRERVKVANKRIDDLENDNKEQTTDITKMKVGFAGVSAVVSIVMSIVSTFIYSLFKQ